jgi:cytochrome c551/c552
VLGATLASAQDGKLLYEQNCSACHLPDQMVVGPSLIEITKLYEKKPKEFVAWAVKPQKKRNGVIEMPSMAHLGEANLLAIRDYMLQASKGLKEKPPITKDLLARPARRPEVPHLRAAEQPAAQCLVGVEGAVVRADANHLRRSARSLRQLATKLGASLRCSAPPARAVAP